MSGGAKDRIDRFRQKEADRKTWEGHWQEVAELVYTKAADFVATQPDGAKRENKIFENTAGRSLQQYAAAAISYTAPGTKKWHTIRHPLDEAMEVQAIAEWYEALRDCLFRYRYSGRSTFQSQLFENFLCQGAFGTGVLFIGSNDRPDLNPTWYRSVPLSQCYIGENAQGQVDQIDRKFPYTARQAKQAFGDNLPEAILRAAEREPERKFTFLHCVGPNGEYDARKADRRGMAFEGAFLSLDEEKLIEQGGFRKLPYAVSRFVTAAGEVYGRGPGLNALPDIKMLNAMMRSYIRSNELQAEPPLLLYKDGALSKFRLAPRALNPGGLDNGGRELVKALNVGGNTNITMDMLERTARAVQEAFLMHLFQILVERPSDTATAALIRDQEKGALLGPQLGRTMHEFYGPMIEREIDILEHKRLLPPPPEELREFGYRWEPEFVSPLMQVQASSDAMALQQVLADVTPLAQVKPKILDRFDEDAILRGLAEARGMPLKFLLSPEDVEALEQADAEQAQAAALAQGAPVMADTLNKLAQAQKFTADAAAAGQ